MALKRLNELPGAHVVRAIMSSEVIENLLPSQRGLCNGANTNPTHSEYHHSDILEMQREKTVKKECECRHSGFSRRGTTISYTSWENTMTK